MVCVSSGMRYLLCLYHFSNGIVGGIYRTTGQPTGGTRYIMLPKAVAFSTAAKQMLTG